MNTIEFFVKYFNFPRLKREFFGITVFRNSKSTSKISSQKNKYGIARIIFKKNSSSAFSRDIKEYLRERVKRFNVMEDKLPNDHVKRLAKVVQFECIQSI